VSGPAEALAPPTVLTYGGRERGEFALDDASTRDRAAAPLRPALVRLLKDTVVQPPVDTHDERVWSLQLVPVPEQGPRWCFAVQAGGGTFGSAGLCQFAFGAPGTEPSALWRWCVARIDEHGVLDPARAPGGLAGEPPPEPSDRERAATLLEGLARGESRIAVDGGPARLAAVFTRLLPLLPAKVVGRYLWSTCLLTVPYTTSRAVVAGRWPAALRAGGDPAAQRVDTWLTGGEASGPGIATGQRRARDWLLDAMSADPPPRVRADAGVAELLDWVETTQLPPLPEQVDGLLAGPAGRRRLAAHPGVLAEWAHQHPDRARRALADPALADPAPADPAPADPAPGDPAPGGLTRPLLDALLDTLRPPHPRDLLALPPAAEPFDGWHERLAELLMAQLPEADLVDLLYYLRGPGLPLAGEDALAAAEPWLLRMGLTRQRQPELFPVSAEAIARRLSASGQLTGWDRPDLESAPNPRELVAAVLRAAAPVTPAVAAELLTLRPRQSSAEPGTGPVLEPSLLIGAARGPLAPWLDELLTLLAARGGEPETQRALLWAGLDQLVTQVSELSEPMRLRWGALAAGDEWLGAPLRLLLRPEGGVARAAAAPGGPGGTRTGGGDGPARWERTAQSAPPPRAGAPAYRSVPPLDGAGPRPESAGPAAGADVARARRLRIGLVVVAVLVLAALASVAAIWLLVPAPP
jgi:hypothetical protein